MTPAETAAQDTIATLVEHQRVAQGLAAKVSDATTLRRIATLVAPNIAAKTAAVSKAAVFREANDDDAIDAPLS